MSCWRPGATGSAALTCRLRRRHRPALLGAFRRSYRLRDAARQGRRRRRRRRIRDGQRRDGAGGRAPRGSTSSSAARTSRASTSSPASAARAWCTASPACRTTGNGGSSITRCGRRRRRRAQSVLRVSAYPRRISTRQARSMIASSRRRHLVVTTPKGRYATDFIIFGTGFRVDLACRPSLPRSRLISGSGATASRRLRHAQCELESSPDLGDSSSSWRSSPAPARRWPDCTASIIRRR